MPELMLKYRAGAFFARLYASDIILGLHSPDEIIDIHTSEETETNKNMKKIIEAIDIEEPEIIEENSNEFDQAESLKIDAELENEWARNYKRSDWIEI